MRISERLTSAAMVTRVSGPTQSQPVNLVLSLAEDVLAMRLGDGPLGESLVDLREMAAQQLSQLEQFRQMGSESVLLREAIEEALEALEFQQEALADFDLFFEQRRQPQLRIAKDKLLESSLQVQKALDHLGELADREGKVACIRCSHYNPPGRSNCEKCSAPLPNLGHSSQSSTFETAEGPAPTQEGDEPVMTSHLVRLYKAVDAVYAGEMEASAFEAEIQHYHNIINNHSEFEIEEPIWETLDEEQRALAEESYKAIEEAQNIFAQGVGEMLQALDCFRSYLESEARSDLEDGVRLMNEGAQKVAAVRDVSKRASES